MDSNICDKENGNIPSNLSVLLEKIQREQDSLSARVYELERDKSSLEESVASKRKISDRHEERLTSLLKRIFLVERDIKSRKSKYDSLVGVDNNENQSVLGSLVSRIEDSKTKIEMSEATKTFLAELSSDLDADWKRIADFVSESEFELETEKGANLCEMRENKEELFLKLSEFRDREGQVELLHDYNTKRDIELQQLTSEKEKLKQLCEGAEKVNKERSEILSKLVTDIKADEERLLTQKEKLKNMLDSVGDGE